MSALGTCQSGPALHKTMEEIKSRKVNSKKGSFTRQDEAMLSTPDALGARQDIASPGFQEPKTEGKLRQSPEMQVSRGLMGL